MRRDDEKQVLIDVVAAIIVTDGRFLACRRKPARGGLWEFPGGKVEPGESVEEALVREIREELSVEIEPGEHFLTVEHDKLRLIFIHARLKGPSPTFSTDHDRIEWLSTDELESVEWAPSDHTAMSKLRAGLQDDEVSARPEGERDSKL